MLFASGRLSHLAKAPFTQHSQEREVTEFDLVQAVGRQLAGASIIGLVDHLFTWA